MKRFASATLRSRDIPPVASGRPAQAILGPVQAFTPNAQVALLAQPVAEDLAFPDRSDGAFLLVDLEPEPAFQEGR
jgi:hypothetical protein